MQALDLNRSIFVALDHLVFLEAGLLATAETKELAEPLTEHLARFGEVFERELGGRRGVLQASARARIADAQLDDELRTLHSGLLHEVRQDRKAPAFATLFPSGLTEVIRHALARQVEIAEQVVQKLGLRLYDDSLRERHLPRLQAALQAGRAALAARREAELRRTDVRLDVQAWKEEAAALRMAVYSQLLGIAAKTRRDRAWVEAFFLSDAGRRSATSDDTEPGIAPAEEPGPDADTPVN